MLLGCLNKFVCELQNNYNLCDFYVTRKMYLVRIKGTFLKNFIHHFLCSSKTKIKEILLKTRTFNYHPASHVRVHFLSFVVKFSCKALSCGANRLTFAFLSAL